MVYAIGGLSGLRGYNGSIIWFVYATLPAQPREFIIVIVIAYNY